MGHHTGIVRYTSGYNPEMFLLGIKKVLTGGGKVTIIKKELSKERS
jgi:hypothetical protein